MTNESHKKLMILLVKLFDLNEVVIEHGVPYHFADEVWLNLERAAEAFSIDKDEVGL